jgi:hypothetical protein
MMIGLPADAGRMNGADEASGADYPVELIFRVSPPGTFPVDHA